MAKLKLEIQKVTYFSTGEQKKTVNGSISLYTDKTGFTVKLPVDKHWNL